MAARSTGSRSASAAPTPSSANLNRITSDRYPDDVVTRYALARVNGQVIAGELEIGACERHLKDIIEGERRGIFWRPAEKAWRALEFFPAVLSVTAGTKAGQPFELLDWHTFTAGSLFGWLTASGRLRFRRGWLETGKGQAKSPLMGGIGLYMMGWYGIPRAEVYSIGQDKATANVLFKDSVAMCRANIPGTEEGETDTLEGREEVIIRGEGDNAWQIEHPSTQSKFKALANGAAISGPRPVLVLADEIHEFKFGHSIETQQAAVAKMPGDAMMLLGTNTPATSQVVGNGYSEFYQRVALGKISDDEAFAFIARVDKKDHETIFDNEECWVKAMPALNITFPIENIRGEVRTARVLTSKAMSVKRLYFGIQLGATEFWIEEDAWSSVQGKVDLEPLRKCRCWLSLDLSQKNDLTALTAVWIDENGHLWAKTWYWTTKDGLADRARADNAPYEQWVEEKWLAAVDGPVIDKTFVAHQVNQICSEFDVQFLAFDPAGMPDFMKACQDVGFPVWLWEGRETNPGQGLKLVSHGQGKKILFYKELDEDKQPIERLCMPRAVERLEDRILETSITIEDSPVTYMCAGNAVTDADGQNNRAFDKKKSRGRIDGLVTIAMAVNAAIAPHHDTKASVYEGRGIRTL